jgi:hypothetical protein
MAVRPNVPGRPAALQYELISRIDGDGILVDSSARYIANAADCLEMAKQ